MRGPGQWRSAPGPLNKGGSMKRSTWRAVPWVVLLIAVAACAQDKGGGAGSKPGDESRMLKIIDPALLARMVDLARSIQIGRAHV